MKTDELQDEIERTRGEMSSTLDAIERKLNPRQLVDQAVDTMRELASDQSSVGHVVRENPIPLALIGLGLGWLAISSMTRKSGGATEYEGYEGYEGAGIGSGSAWASTGGLETTSSSGAEYGYGYAPGQEAGYGESRSGNGQGMRDKASQVAGQARETVARATDQTKARVSQWSRTARGQASQAADRTWEAYQEHPLTMGVMAIMMGAALGAILPRSRTEDEVMGSKARGAMRQMRETAEDVADKAGQVAETAYEKAKEGAKEAIRETSEATSDEARRQGLTGSSGSTLTH